MQVFVSGSVMEYDSVRKAALSSGQVVHFGSVFPLCVENYSELPHDERTYKGRVVFERPCVSDQNSKVGVFEASASSASLMSSSKMVDIIGCQKKYDSGVRRASRLHSE